MHFTIFSEIQLVKCNFLLLHNLISILFQLFPLVSFRHPSLIMKCLGRSITEPLALLLDMVRSSSFLVLNLDYLYFILLVSHTEMTHGFDSNGRKFDLHGFMKNWWSNDTLTKFNNKTACIRDQYSAIYNPTVGLNISGERTLGENIADNGGIKEAYGAYKLHMKKKNDGMLLPALNFTSDQLFFVGYANVSCNSPPPPVLQACDLIQHFFEMQTFCEAISPHRLKEQFLKDAHSPGRYRVNVALGNTPQFAEAFKCPLGSKMNPVKKCSVW